MKLSYCYILRLLLLFHSAVIPNYWHLHEWTDVGLEEAERLGGGSWKEVTVWPGARQIAVSSPFSITVKWQLSKKHSSKTDLKLTVNRFFSPNAINLLKTVKTTNINSQTQGKRQNHFRNFMSYLYGFRVSFWMVLKVNCYLGFAESWLVNPPFLILLKRFSIKCIIITSIRWRLIGK